MCRRGQSVRRRSPFSHLIQVWRLAPISSAILLWLRPRISRACFGLIIFYSVDLVVLRPHFGALIAKVHIPAFGIAEGFVGPNLFGGLAVNSDLGAIFAKCVFHDSLLVKCGSGRYGLVGSLFYSPNHPFTVYCFFYSPFSNNFIIPSFLTISQVSRTCDFFNFPYVTL